MAKSKNIIISVLLVLLLTLLSINVFATDPNWVPLNSWNGVNNGALGYNQEYFYQANYNLSTSQIGNYQTSSSTGLNAPSVLDLDEDGTNELISYSGSTVFIYNGSANVLNLENSVSLTGTIKNVVGFVGKSHYGNLFGDKPVLAVLTSTNAYLIAYNGATAYTYIAYTLQASDILTSNLACGSDLSGATNVSYCAFFTNTTFLKVFSGSEFDAVYTASYPLTYYNYTANAPKTNKSVQNLIVSDVDNDLSDEISFTNGTTFFSKRYDEASILYTISMALDVTQTFSLYKNYLGYITATSSTSTVIIKDIPTGATIVSSAKTLGTSTNGGYGAFLSTDSSNVYYYASEVYQNSGQKYLNRIVLLNGSTYNISDTDCGQGADLTLIQAGYIRPNEYNIIQGSCLFNLTALITSSYTANTNMNWVIADITADYNSELIQYKSGVLGVTFKDAINVPSSLTLSSLPNAGYSGYYTPICKGTTITYQAKECVNTPYTDCNYFNTVTNARERLATSCGFGIGSPMINGSYSYLSPSVSCTYSNVGNYTIFVYLQAESQPTDYALRNPYPLGTNYIIEVNNGLSGVDCNLNYVTNPSYNYTNTNGTIPTNNDSVGGNIEFNDTPVTLPDGYAGDSMWNAIWSGLLGQSPLTRLILGAVIIMLGMFAMLTVTQNPTMLLIAFGCMMLIVFAMQLIPLWVPALIVVIFIAMWGLNASLSRKD
jgi:hypothetical protein